jgi:AcrR family transcriptional regulator
MSRPSRNTDRLLIEAAKALIPKTGFAHLKIRDVARKANVNLGMFNYHFKTKDHFIEILLSEVYEDFFNKVSIESATGANSKERLRNAILTITRFFLANRALIVPFVEAIMLGDKHIMAFAKKNMTRHIAILLQLVKQCQKDGYIEDISVFTILPVMMGSVLGPTVLISMFDRFAQTGLLSKVFMRTIANAVISKKAMEKRIDIIFKGISAGA